jgi:hypothetical protein
MEKAKALDISQRMSKSNGARIINLEENDDKREAEDFWKELGGKGDVVRSGLPLEITSTRIRLTTH